MTYCFSQLCSKRPAGFAPLLFDSAGSRDLAVLSSRAAKIKHRSARVEIRVNKTGGEHVPHPLEIKRYLARVEALPLVSTVKCGLRTSVQRTSPAIAMDGTRAIQADSEYDRSNL